MAGMAGLRTTHEFANVSMETWVNVQVVSDQPREVAEPAVQRALAWFETVERICTRFDPTSEVMQLLGKVGRRLSDGPGRTDRWGLRSDGRRHARTTGLQRQLPDG